MIKVKSVILGLATLVLALGLNFRHVLDDYGILNNKLHVAVLAQTNGSGGSSSGGGSSGGGSGGFSAGVSAGSSSGQTYVGAKAEYTYKWVGGQKVVASASCVYALNFTCTLSITITF